MCVCVFVGGGVDESKLIELKLSFNTHIFTSILRPHDPIILKIKQVMFLFHVILLCYTRASLILSTGCKECEVVASLKP